MPQRASLSLSELTRRLEAAEGPERHELAVLIAWVLGGVVVVRLAPWIVAVPLLGPYLLAALVLVVGTALSRLLGRVRLRDAVFHG